MAGAEEDLIAELIMAAFERAGNGVAHENVFGQLFGKAYSLAGVYKLLHRLGYNDLMPRPHHPDTDPAALEAFKKRNCPGVWLTSAPSARASAS